jgi:hypothetical protein
MTTLRECGAPRCQQDTHYTRIGSGGGVECTGMCRRILECQELGNLAVSELVDVRPLLLEGAARRLNETALEAQDDDRAALRDELAGLEPLEFKVPPTQEKNSATPSRPRRVPAKGITEGP